MRTSERRMLLAREDDENTRTREDADRTERRAPETYMEQARGSEKRTGQQ